jgi:hypothetical protein
LFILSLALILAGYILTYSVNIGISLVDIIWLTLSFYLTVIISLFFFFTGQKKETGSQASYTLFSITLKFLIELIIALFWFLIAKKTSLSSVLLFFVLYLTFTMFYIVMILNTLKNKTL